MRKITIVGGGQSGFQLAIGLLQNGYQVRVVHHRDRGTLGAPPSVT